MAVVFHHLPEKVLEEIMSRLPTESLLQFKRVNKSCYFLISSLINNQTFVTKHICNKISSTTLVFEQPSPIPCDDDDNEDEDSDLIDDKTIFSLLSLSNDDNDKDHIRSVTEELNLPPVATKGEGDSEWQVICHCDGIICLVRDHMAVMLCNPLLQESKLLPKSKNENTNTSSLGIGFGYDSRAKDYKLVRIFNRPNYVGAEIYTLGTDSWKDISIPKALEGLTDREDAMYWKDICYWALEDANKDMIILSFDMRDGVFRITPFPNNTAFPVNSMSFTVWNDSVALLLCSRKLDTSNSTSFEICVMGEYCDILKGFCPWTKHLVFRLQLGILVPLAFWKGDELLMEDSDGAFFSYNLHTLKLRNTGVKGSVNMPVCFYEKSLVSLQRRYTNLDSKRRKANH